MERERIKRNKALNDLFFIIVWYVIIVLTCYGCGAYILKQLAKQTVGM